MAGAKLAILFASVAGLGSPSPVSKFGQERPLEIFLQTSR